MKNFPVFPDDELEFDKMFSTDRKCVKYLFKQKWPDGFKCSYCGHEQFWESKRKLYICKKCEHQHSITADTIFHQTHKSLKYWFKALWLFTVSKSGISATELSKRLPISYPTAWTWFQKLKRCTVNPEREMLSGTVEVDEAYLGGRHSGKRGRGSENKQKVAIAVEEREIELPNNEVLHVMGRIRISVISDCSSSNLESFIKDNISKGSVLITDKWKGYTNELRRNFEHIAIESANSPVLDRLHTVVSLLKRWILGTLQGSLKTHHTQEYMDEFVFRFNRRNFSSVGAKFHRLLILSSATKPITYREIIKRLEKT